MEEEVHRSRGGVWHPLSLICISYYSSALLNRVIDHMLTNNLRIGVYGSVPEVYCLSMLINVLNREFRYTLIVFDIPNGVAPKDARIQDGASRYAH